MPLVSMTQRQSYKQDYNAEYDEYCQLHAVVGNISAHFNELAEQCRRLKQGKEEYKVTVTVFLSDVCSHLSQIHPHTAFYMISKNSLYSQVNYSRVFTKSPKWCASYFVQFLGTHNN